MHRQSIEEEKEKGFPLKVTYRNSKTNLITKKDPYIMRVVSDGAGGKSELFERPAGSGNLFNKKGEAIGRWDKTKPEGKRFLKDEKHIEWTPPLTEDQKLAKSLISKDARIEELEKELASIKAEKKAKSTN